MLLILTFAVCISRAVPATPGRVYVFREGTFVPSVRPPSCRPLDPWPCPLALPVDWHVTGSVTADVTGDGAPECVLLVWRPWQDWPTQRWSPIASPIETFHDAAGDSCHLILLDPATGREVWAGSALPAPLLALAVGDMDGDEQREVVTLEGSYAGGRAGVASHVDVWRWNGFGFTLMWRSPPGAYRALCLEDVDGDGVLDIAVH